LQLIADLGAKRGHVDPNAFVFPGRRPGRPLQQIQSCWDEVCKHAGLADVRVYDLRHTFAATGASGGMGLPLIGRLLGHTTPRTTMRYAHLTDDPLREAADKIAKVLVAGKGGAEVLPLPTGRRRP
jgi:integrase